MKKKAMRERERERERERDLPKGEEGKPIEEVVGMEFDVFTFALLMKVIHKRK